MNNFDLVSDVMWDVVGAMNEYYEEQEIYQSNFESGLQTTDPYQLSGSSGRSLPAFRLKSALELQAMEKLYSICIILLMAI